MTLRKSVLVAAIVLLGSAALPAYQATPDSTRGHHGFASEPSPIALFVGGLGSLWIARTLARAKRRKA